MGKKTKILEQALKLSVEGLDLAIGLLMRQATSDDLIIYNDEHMAKLAEIRRELKRLQDKINTQPSSTQPSSTQAWDYCDWGHQDKEIRILPTSAGGNLMVCKRHFNAEMRFREERNLQTDEPGRWKIEKWENLKIYRAEERKVRYTCVSCRTSPAEVVSEVDPEIKLCLACWKKDILSRNPKAKIRKKREAKWTIQPANKR